MLLTAVLIYLLADYAFVNRETRKLGPDGGVVAESCRVGGFATVSTGAIDGVRCARTASKGDSLRVSKPSGFIGLVRISMGNGALMLAVSGRGGVEGAGGLGVAMDSPGLSHVGFGNMKGVGVRGGLAAGALSVRDGKINGVRVRSLDYRGLAIDSVKMNGMGLGNGTRDTGLCSGNINSMRTAGLRTVRIGTSSRKMKGVSYGTIRSLSTTMENMKDVRCGNSPMRGAFDGGNIKDVGDVR